MIKQDDDYTVRLVDIPTNVPAMVCYDDDDWPNVYINSRLNRETQRKALRHELKHIERGDVYTNAPIGRVEAG